MYKFYANDENIIYSLFNSFSVDDSDAEFTQSEGDLSMSEYEPSHHDSSSDAYDFDDEFLSGDDLLEPSQISNRPRSRKRKSGGKVVGSRKRRSTGEILNEYNPSQPALSSFSTTSSSSQSVQLNPTITESNKRDKKETGIPF